MLAGIFFFVMSPKEGLIERSLFSGLFVSVGSAMFLWSIRPLLFPSDLTLDPEGRSWIVRRGRMIARKIKSVVPLDSAAIVLRPQATWHYPLQKDGYRIDLDRLSNESDDREDRIQIAWHGAYEPLRSLCVALVGEDEVELFRDETLVPVRLRSGEIVELTTAPTGDTVAGSPRPISSRQKATLVLVKSSWILFCVFLLLASLSVAFGSMGAYKFASHGDYAGAAVFVIPSLPFAALFSAAAVVTLLGIGSRIELDFDRREMRI